MKIITIFLILTFTLTPIAQAREAILMCFVSEVPSPGSGVVIMPADCKEMTEKEYAFLMKWLDMIDWFSIVVGIVIGGGDELLDDIDTGLRLRDKLRWRWRK